MVRFMPEVSLNIKRNKKKPRPTIPTTSSLNSISNGLTSSLNSIKNDDNFANCKYIKPEKQKCQLNPEFVIIEDSQEKKTKNIVTNSPSSDTKLADTNLFQLLTESVDSSSSIMVPDTHIDIKESDIIGINDTTAPASSLLNSTNDGFLDPNAISVTIPLKSRGLQKRRLDELLKNENLDRTKVKMMDLIYLNGTMQPMASKFNKKLVADLNTVIDSSIDEKDEIKSEHSYDDSSKDSNEKKNHISDGVSDNSDNDYDDGDCDSNGSNDFMSNMPVTQLKFNSKGEIVMDHESLHFETSAAKRARDFMANSKVVVLDENSPRPNYHKKQVRRRDWYIEETKRFYRCLQAIGTDFAMMVPFFPGRDRRSLKLKFKREERVNPQLIDKAILNPKEFNIDELKAQLAQDEEDMKKRLALKAENAANALLEMKAKKRRYKEKIKVPKNSAAHRILSGLSVYDEELTENSVTDQTNELDSTIQPSVSEKITRKPRVFKCKKTESLQDTEIHLITNENEELLKTEDIENETTNTASDVNNTVETSNVITEAKVALPLDTPEIATESKSIEDSQIVLINQENISCEDNLSISNMSYSILIDQDNSVMNNVVNDDNSEQNLNRRLSEIISNSEEDVVILENYVNLTIGEGELINIDYKEDNNEQVQTIIIGDESENTICELKEIENTLDNNIEPEMSNDNNNLNVENISFSILIDQDKSLSDNAVIDDNTMQCLNLKVLNDLIDNTQNDVIILNKHEKKSGLEKDKKETCTSIINNDINENNEQLQTFIIDDETENTTYNRKELEQFSNSNIENTMEIDQYNNCEENSSNANMSSLVLINQDNSLNDNEDVVDDNDLQCLTLEKELDDIINDNGDDVMIIKKFLKSNFPKQENESMEANSKNNCFYRENDEQFETFIIDDESKNTMYNLEELRTNSDETIIVTNYDIDSIEKIDITRDSSDDEVSLAALKRDLTATTESVLETMYLNTSKTPFPKKRTAERKENIKNIKR